MCGNHNYQRQFLNDKCWCTNITKIVRDYYYLFTITRWMSTVSMVQECALFRPMYQKKPQDSDADLSNVDDPIEDPDYHPVREEVILSPWMKMMLPQQAHPRQSQVKSPLFI